MSPEPKFGPLRLEHMVGREQEFSTIKAALGDTGSTYVLTISGLGGIGKTRLIEEAMAHARAGGAIVISGLIDLFFTELHSDIAIERMICEALDGKHGSGFARYRQALADYERLQKELVSGKRLEPLRAKLWQAFVADFNAFAAAHRVLLTFDTAEAVQHESGNLEDLCKVDQATQSTAVQGWLLQTLPRLTNTVVLIAGRPSYYYPDRPRLIFWDVVDRTFAQEAAGRGDFSFTPLVLGELNEKDGLDYFAALIETMAAGGEKAGYDPDLIADLQSIPLEYRRQVYAYTEGRPIRLSLICEYLRYQGNITVLFPDEPGENGTVQWQDIEAQFVQELRRVLPPRMEQLLDYLAAAQIGLDADLLLYLCHSDPGYPAAQCIDDIAQLTRLSFVKARTKEEPGQPPQTIVFLHDEIHDMFFKQEVTGEGARAGYWQRAAEYYEQQFADAAGDRQAQLDLEIKLIHYALRANVVQGYDHYLRAIERALNEHRAPQFLKLRDERIRYFNVPQFQAHAEEKRLGEAQINRDSTLHWVRYHQSRERGDTARSVVEAVLSCAPQPEVRQLAVQGPPPETVITPETEAIYRTGADDVLFWASLLTVYAQVITFTAKQGDEIVQAILAKARVLLRDAGMSVQHPDLKHSPHPRWYASMVMGSIFHQLCYLYQVSSRYDVALIAARQASELLTRVKDESGITDPLAQLLSDQAVVMALVGRFKIALDTIRDAIELRSANKGSYPLAITQSTYSRVITQAGYPDQGRTLAEQALEVFDSLEENRGIILACRNLGAACRQMGELWKQGVIDPDAAETCYHDAVAYLERAINVYRSAELDEPRRLWESLNELGSTHIDIANLYKKGMPDVDDAEAAEHLDLAVAYLLDALEALPPGKMLPERGDTYDDLAQAYADAEDYEHAGQALQAMEALIPPAYFLQPGTGSMDITRPQYELWALLGKDHRQRAIWAIRQAAELDPRSVEYQELLADSARNFALSVAYFGKYWAGTHYIEMSLRSAHLYTHNLRPRLRRQMRDAVRGVAASYHVDLHALEEVLWEAGDDDPLEEMLA